MSNYRFKITKRTISIYTIGSLLEKKKLLYKVKTLRSLPEVKGKIYVTPIKSYTETKMLKEVYDILVAVIRDKVLTKETKEMKEEIV